MKSQTVKKKNHLAICGAARVDYHFIHQRRYANAAGEKEHICDVIKQNEFEDEKYDLFFFFFFLHFLLGIV